MPREAQPAKLNCKHARPRRVESGLGRDARVQPLYRQQRNFRDEASQYGYAQRLRCASGRAGQLHAKVPCKLDRSLIEPRFGATPAASSCTTLFDYYSMELGAASRYWPCRFALAGAYIVLGRGPPAIRLADRPVIPLQPQCASLFLGHERQ